MADYKNLNNLISKAFRNTRLNLKYKVKNLQNYVEGFILFKLEEFQFLSTIICIYAVEL